MDRCTGVQYTGTELLRGLWNTRCTRRERGSSFFFSLRMRWLKGDLTAVFNCLMGGCRAGVVRLLWQVCGDSMTANRHKLQCGK